MIDKKAPVVDLQDNVLKAAEQKVESQLTPKNHDAYLRIITTGMKAALANGPNSMAAKLTHSKDPIGDAARGAVSLVILMSHQAKGRMPPEAMVPAAATLMFHALDFLDRTGVVKIGTEELVQATHIQTNFLLAKFKITPDMLKNAAANVHKVMQDPTAMEKINRKAGTVRAPGVSSPTELGVDDGV